jgi:hypothetical protein
MPGVPFTVTAAFLLAAAEYDVSIRTEVRSRTPYPGDTSTSVSGDIQVDPLLATSLTAEQARLTLTYTPQLLISDAAGSGRISSLHRGDLLGRWSLSQRFGLSAEQELSVGTYNFSPLLAAPPDTPPPVDRLPPVQAVQYIGSTSTLGIQYSASGSARLSISGGFIVTGGADEQAQLVLPLQRGPRADVKLAWNQSPRDTLSGQVQAWYVLASPVTNPAMPLSATNREESILVDTLGTWQRALSPHTTGELGVGIALVNARGPYSQHAVLPAGTSQIRHVVPIPNQRLELTAGLKVGPVVDRLSGAVLQRVDGSAGVMYAPTVDLTLTAQGNSGVVVAGAGQAGTGVVLAGADASYKFNSHLTGTVGGRSSWALGTGFYGAGNFQWTAYVAFAVSAHGGL